MERVKACPWCGSLEVYSRGDQHLCGKCKRQFRAAAHIDGGYAEVPLSIFLSYGHEDEEFVSLVRERLELRGHEVFFDRVNIKPGEDWRSRLMRSIVTSDRFVAFLSSHAFREDGVCREELRIAEAVRGGNIQVVLLQPEETLDMPSSLTDLQWIDCVGWKKELDRGGAAFRKWFNERMDEIVRMLESDESARLEEEMRFLDQRLNASQGDSRRLSLQEKPFYGRRWMDEQVDKWLNDDNAPHACVIVGQPGLGKSAYAAHLSNWDSMLSGKILASVFCARSHDTRCDPSGAIHTLVYELAKKIPQYRARLCETLKAYDNLSQLSGGSLFELLVAKPLAYAVKSGHRNVCVVIDGIDEAGYPGRNPLAEIIGNGMAFLPRCVRLLVTSRNDSASTEPFAVSSLRLDMDGYGDESVADVAGYLRDCLAPLKSDSGFENAIERLAYASDGVFMYAEVMTDLAIKRGVPLGELTLDVPDGLGPSFLQWFKWTFPSVDEYRSEFREALGCVAAVPGGAFPLAEFGVLFGWDDDKTTDFLSRLEVYLKRVEDPLGGESVSIVNVFWREWIGSEAAGRYRCDMSGALKLMGSKYHHMARSDIQLLNDWQAAHVLEILEYAEMHDEVTELWAGGDLCNRCLELVNGLRDDGKHSAALNLLHALVDVSESGGVRFARERSAILNAYGNLLRDTGRMSEAEAAYRESLSILRSLAEAEPAAWLPYVAMALNNLGILLRATGRMGRAGDSFRLSAEAEKLAKKSAQGWVDVSSLLEEIDTFLTVSSLNRDGHILGAGVLAEAAEAPDENTSDKVREAIIGLTESSRAMRLRNARHARDDVAVSVSTYADDVDHEDVLAVAAVRRGFFRRGISGYLCTEEALYSNYLDGSCIPFAEVRHVELATNGVQITPLEGDAVVVDFEELNDEVFQVLSRVIYALKRT